MPRASGRPAGRAALLSLFALFALFSAVPVAASWAQTGEPPLAPFAAQRVSVLPVQFLRGDTAAPVSQAQWAVVRSQLDDSIGTAIFERGVGNKWAYAADLARLAKRNTGYVSDPATLGAGSLRNRALRADDQAPTVLLNNLRPLIALGDSRYALIPIELAFAGKGPDMQAVLRLVLLDGRGGKLIWFADLTVPAASEFSSAQIGALAQRVADLVAGR